MRKTEVEWYNKCKRDQTERMKKQNWHIMGEAKISFFDGVGI
jgi:hypothetical protein